MKATSSTRPSELKVTGTLSGFRVLRIKNDLAGIGGVVVVGVVVVLVVVVLVGVTVDDGVWEQSYSGHGQPSGHSA